MNTIPMDRADFKRLANKMSRAFRDSHGGGIIERFEAVSKLLFVKIVDEREVAGTWGTSPKKERADLFWRPGDSERTVYERARSTWSRATGGANASVFRGSRSSFPKDVGAVAKVVSLLEPVHLEAVNEDVKGAAYEELLKDTFEKNDNQQYFTPRHLMDFVVAMANPTSDDEICDPASGSGGFLVGALNWALETGDDGASKLPKVVGVDIDERMAWVARINILLHGGDPASVFHLPGAGSLLPTPKIQHALPRNSFSMILTNPPFGSDMTDREALSAFKTGKGKSTRRRGVLFIERCLSLLRPGGLLAVVIDDSILNLAGNSDIRSIMRKTSIVEAVISLPDVAFMPYSTAKSSVVLLRKKKPGDSQGPVFMADVENVGNRPNGDPLYEELPSQSGDRQLLSDLPSVLESYRDFQKNGSDTFKSSTTTYLANIEAYADQPAGDRLDANFYHPAREQANSVLDTATVPVRRLRDIVDFPATSVRVADEYGDEMIRWIGLGDIRKISGEFECSELPGSRIKSVSHSFKPGDVLISRLRPKLRKVVHIVGGSGEGACSGELVVLRQKTDPAHPILMEYIAMFLRTDLAYGQQVYQITGVGRPRVGVETLKNLRLPVPTTLDEQEEIVNALNGSFDEYTRLNQEAERLKLQASDLLSAAYSSTVDSVVSGSSGESGNAWTSAGSERRASA